MASSTTSDHTPIEPPKSIEITSLIELRTLLEEVIATNSLHSPRQPRPKSSSTDLSPSLWGVPLQPSRRHVGTNVILLKFLKASDYKPVQALEMIRRTVKWRREIGADRLANEEPEVPGFKGHMCFLGVDRGGRPVSYNMCGSVIESVFCGKAIGKEMEERILRYRVHFMEKGIKQLSFRKEGRTAITQVIDLKDSSLASPREFRLIVKKLFLMSEEYYPEFIEQHIFINVSFRYYAYHALYSGNINQRTKNRFIFAKPSRVTETLLKYISAENIPVQYGGLYRKDDDEFSGANAEASELPVKGGCPATVEFPIDKPGVTVVWDIAVVGWDVHLKEEFIPEDECSYSVLIRKEKRLEETTRNSFYISEPGKIVLTVTNRTHKKKRILYRFKSKPTVPIYTLLEQSSIT